MDLVQSNLTPMHHMVKRVRLLCTNRGDKTAVYRIGKVFITEVEG